MNLKDTYNKIAKDWHEDHKLGTWWIDMTDKFISLLRPNDLVLDVGCGGGIKAKYLIDKGLQVVGIDFSEKMIEIAKREVPAAKFIELDLNDIDKLKNEFDGIFALGVLLHTPKKDASKVVKKMTDKLKPNGYIYISVKEITSTNKEEEIRTENDYGYTYKRFFSYFTQEEVEEYLKNAGLKIIESKIIHLKSSNRIQVIAQK